MPSPLSSPHSEDSPSAIARAILFSSEDEVFSSAPTGANSWNITNLSNSIVSSNSLRFDQSRTLESLNNPDHQHTQSQPSRRRSTVLTDSNLDQNRLRRGVARADGRRRMTRHSNIVANQATEDLFNSFMTQMNTNGANGFEALTNNINNSNHRRTQANSNRTSALDNKIVYKLECKFCNVPVCTRAMMAILLANTQVELYSTDIPPPNTHLLHSDRMTHGCFCRIRDTVCGGCGNELGYHVSQPCDKCMTAKNNGHFWMFYSDNVIAVERLCQEYLKCIEDSSAASVLVRVGPIDGTGQQRSTNSNNKQKLLYWGSLSPNKDYEDADTEIQWELYCR